MARIAAAALVALILPGWSQSTASIQMFADRVGICQKSTDETAYAEADKNMVIARFYIGRRYYHGAVTRLKVVVTQFQTSRHVEEALARLTETYLVLGLSSEAQTAAAVLDRNFPSSHWSATARDALRSRGLAPAENEQSWISRTFK